MVKSRYHFHVGSKHVRQSPLAAGKAAARRLVGLKDAVRAATIPNWDGARLAPEMFASREALTTIHLLSGFMD